VDGRLTTAFAGTMKDQLLSFDGFDIDVDDELEIILNGDSLGFLDAGINNGLESYQIAIAGADQIAGDNILEFKQAINSKFQWGITI